MVAEFSRKIREICYHGAMESARTPTPLRREVLPPHKAEQGLGVLILVSSAMFCAILSSALVLQARNARHCPGMNGSVNDVEVGVDLQAERIVHVDELHIPPGTRALVEIIDVADPVAARAAADECGTPMYEKNADGSVTAVLPVCPQRARGQWELKSASVDRAESADR